MIENMPDLPEKNPAAVEMGKRRQAKMTAEERAQFISAGAAAAAERNRKRTPEERRAIARKAARTVREGRGKKFTRAGSPGEPPARDAELAQLSRAIETISDEELEKLYSALAGRFGV